MMCELFEPFINEHVVVTTHDHQLWSGVLKDTDGDFVLLKGANLIQDNVYARKLHMKRGKTILLRAVSIEGNDTGVE